MWRCQYFKVLVPSLSVEVPPDWWGRNGSFHGRISRKGGILSIGEMSQLPTELASSRDRRMNMEN